MKAAVSRSFGPPDVVTVADVPRPEPRGDEILVRVRAAAVGVVDGLARRGSPWYARAHFGLLRPRFPVLGCDFAGQVEAAGPAVSRFGVGEAVFGTIAPRFGAHAEYICLPEHGAVAPKPACELRRGGRAGRRDGAVLPAGQGGPAGGQAVLVNGASGAVGSAAVQLAVHFGATVTGVCSGPHLRLVRKLGAESVIDYTRTDFTRAGRRYDVIFDVAGTSSFGRCRRALNPGGVYLTTAPSPAIFAQMPWTARFGSRRAVVAFTGLRPAAEKQKDLLVIRELAEASALVPVVGACYPLARIADAYRHVDAGHKKGTVVITMS